MARGKKLPLAAFLGSWADQLGDFGHFPADLFLDDFAQGNVRDALAGGSVHKGTAQTTAAGIELANTAGDQVDEDVRVADFFGGFFSEFSVHYKKSPTAYCKPNWAQDLNL